MRNTIIAALILLTIMSPASLAAQKEPAIDPRISKAFGPLPKRGNLADILTCSGANEVAWMTLMKENPGNPEAHEAKRKAGFYAAVALSVFELDSQEVIAAVRTASTGPVTDTLKLARQCRAAPQNWRE